MTDLLIPRRKFLTGLFGLVAAPAIVKAANIMPVKVVEPKWFLNDGLPLQTMIHPVQRRGPVGLSELREILRPGLEKMFDEMYEANSGRWKSIFTSEGL